MLTIAEQKGLIAAQMVEELVDEGKRLSLLQALLRLVTLGLADTRGFESHHLAAYTLTSLIEPAHREWLISMDFEEEALMYESTAWDCRRWFDFGRGIRPRQPA